MNIWYVSIRWTGFHCFIHVIKMNLIGVFIEWNLEIFHMKHVFHLIGVLFHIIFFYFFFKTSTRFVFVFHTMKITNYHINYNFSSKSIFNYTTTKGYVYHPHLKLDFHSSNESLVCLRISCFRFVRLVCSFVVAHSGHWAEWHQGNSEILKTQTLGAPIPMISFNSTFCFKWVCGCVCVCIVWRQRYSNYWKNIKL